MKRKETGNFSRNAFLFTKNHLGWISFAGACQSKRKRDHGAERRNPSLRSAQSSSFEKSIAYKLQGLRGEEVFYFKGRPASAPHFESPSLRKADGLVSIHERLRLSSRSFLCEKPLPEFIRGPGFLRKILLKIVHGSETCGCLQGCLRQQGDRLDERKSIPCHDAIFLLQPLHRRPMTA